MKLSGNMCLMIILNVTKKQGFNLSLENTLFQLKPQGEPTPSHPPGLFGVKLRS